MDQKMLGKFKSNKLDQINKQIEYNGWASPSNTVK